MYLRVLAPNSPEAAKPDSYIKQLAVIRDIAGLDVCCLWNSKLRLVGGKVR